MKTSGVPHLVLSIRVGKSVPCASKFASILDRMSTKLQSKLGGLRSTGQDGVLDRMSTKLQSKLGGLR
eukprot:1137870-Pelagomonas_calceolata.AAC.1